MNNKNAKKRMEKENAKNRTFNIPVTGIEPVNKRIFVVRYEGEIKTKSNIIIPAHAKQVKHDREIEMNRYRYFVVGVASDCNVKFMDMSIEKPKDAKDQIIHLNMLRDKIRSLSGEEKNEVDTAITQIEQNLGIRKIRPGDEIFLPFRESINEYSIPAITDYFTGKELLVLHETEIAGVASMPAKKA